MWCVFFLSVNLLTFNYEGAVQLCFTVILKIKLPLLFLPSLIDTTECC